MTPESPHPPQGPWASRPAVRARPARTTREDVSPAEEPTVAIPAVSDDRVDQAGEPGAEDDGHEPTLTDLALDSVLAGRAPAAAPARRRRRWGLVALAGLLVLLLVAAVSGLFAEDYARRTADQRISAALSDALDTQAQAEVMDRFVLRSLARGSIDQIDFNAPRSRIRTGEDSSLELLSISGTATHVTNISDPQNAVIGNLSGSVVVEWSELTRLSGVDIRPATDGRVQVDRTISVLGADIGVQITALPKVDRSSGRIILEDPKARAARVPIPAILLQSALDRVNERLVLPPLPSITYESMTVTGAGLKLDVSGADVPLNALG